MPKLLTPDRIYWKHQLFAFRCIKYCCRGGIKGPWFRVPGFVHAYIMTWPAARSRAGARASTSRLLKRQAVRAALQWEYAKHADRIIPQDEPMPETVGEIRTRLEALDSRRARRF